MGVNPNITEETGLFPVLFNSAYTTGRAAVTTTPSTATEQRAIQANAVGDNADLALVQRFLGVGSSDVENGRMGSVQRRGRVRAQGGAAIVAPALITWDVNGKFVTYTPDGAKFAFIAGYAASDCAGDLSFFDLVLCPMIIGPASSVNITITGTLQAEQVTSTDDAAVAGLITVGEYIEQTEIADPAAPAANKCRLYVRDNGGKTELVARFPTGAVQQVAIEP